MACRMAMEPRRMPTAQGIYLALKTYFLPSTPTHLISSFSHAGAFENGLRHGHGIETDVDGSRYLSLLEESRTLISFLTHFILYF